MITLLHIAGSSGNRVLQFAHLRAVLPGRDAGCDRSGWTLSRLLVITLLHIAGSSGNRVLQFAHLRAVLPGRDAGSDRSGWTLPRLLPQNRAH